MASSLIDLLRKSEGKDDIQYYEDDDEEAEGGEKLRFGIFNDNYIEIDANPELQESPVKGSWVFPILYKSGAKGHTHKWQIGYNATSKKILWTVGRVETEGMILFTADVIPTKSQKGSFMRKAYQMAIQKFELKIKNGFHEGMKGESSLGIPLPMLANLYKPPTENSEGNVPHFPVAAQSKLDGERHLVHINDDGEVIQMSRQMNRREHFDHIRTEAGKLLEFLPPGTILDGELFTPEIDFQEITSIAGSKRAKHPKEQILQYFIFDLYHPRTIWTPVISKELAKSHSAEGDRGFVYAKASGFTVENYDLEAREYFEIPHDEEEVNDEMSLQCVEYGGILDGGPIWVVEVRIALLMNAFRCFRVKYGHWPKFLKLVKTYVINKREDIDKIFHEMLKMKIGKEKLEGLILRHMSRGSSNPAMSLYRPGRSDSLLKVKPVHSTEVVITGVKAGKDKHKDLAVLVYKEPDTGISGTVVPSLTHEARREILLNPDSVIGKTMTVTFQNRMRSGALRFPVGKAFIE